MEASPNRHCAEARRPPPSFRLRLVPLCALCGSAPRPRRWKAFCGYFRDLWR